MADKRRPGTDEMIVSVNLYTNRGELVASVVTVTYLKRPEILIWGERLFTWSEEHEQYREGFGVVLLINNPLGMSPGNHYDDVQREQRT